MINKSKKLLFVIFTSLILFSLTSVSISNISAANLSTSLIQLNSALTPHDHILISNNGNFTDYGFPGSGTAQDPYRIENYNITTLALTGINIHSTTDYFVVQDCYVDAHAVGIAISDITPGTGEISGVTCVEHDFYGIAIAAAQITLKNSISIDCSGTFGAGALIYNSFDITVDNNTFTNNNYGLYMENSNSCLIYHNTFEDSNYEGVFLNSDTNNNILHHNKFINNNGGASLQARDDGIGNIWYEEATKLGNYWDNWTDSKTVVPILGSANNEDPYPLDEDLTRETNLYFLSVLLALAFIVYRKRTGKKK